MDAAPTTADDRQMVSLDAHSDDQPRSAAHRHRRAFPPIDDYAFLSDCENTCLIARNGAVEWMCIPRPDSPSVFGAVLDRSAGHFRIAPYGQNVPAARRYLPGGLIVETTWQTPRQGGSSSATHSCSARGTTWSSGLAPAAAPPHGLGCRTHPAADRQMRERHRGPRDELRARVRLPPRRRSVGVHRQGLRGSHRHLHVERSGRPPDTPADQQHEARAGRREARARTRMVEDDNVFVALSWSHLPAPQTYDEAAEKMWQTAKFWREWITTGRFPRPQVAWLPAAQRPGPEGG